MDNNNPDNNNPDNNKPGQQLETYVALVYSFAAAILKRSPRSTVILSLRFVRPNIHV